MTRSRVCAALVSRKSRGYSQHNGLWIVLVAAPVQPARTGDHIAFGSTPEVVEATAAKLQAMGREFIRARSNRSLYFFDYDDHVFELSTENIDDELATQKAS
jgi:fosfomycin resistance protein FosX